MHRLAPDEPSERLIDSATRLEAIELEALERSGWRLVDTVHRVSQRGNGYVGHKFRHVDAAPPGAI